MKKFFLFILMTASLFFFSFVAARVWDKGVQKKNSSIIQMPTFTLKNRPFVFVVVGYNNGACLSKTLQSIFAQNYDNYRLIYIDDASNDGSFDLVTDLVGESGKFLQTTLVKNEERLGLLANIVRSVEICQDDEIVVILQVNDWLSHEWVLQKLNAYYADPDIWIALGQFCHFPHYERGENCNLNVSNFRNISINSSNLQSFYASLFKKIRPSDLYSGGKFFPCASDLAYMIPMLEMAKKHTLFTSEILTVKNDRISDPIDLELQVRCEKYIRSLDPYQPIVSLMEAPCGE